MSIPTTLEDIKSYIDGLGSFPVDRETQVRYGYGDGKSMPMVQFNNHTGTPTYTTAVDPCFWDTAFSVTSFARSNFAALALAREVDAVLSGHQVTPNTDKCFNTGYKVEQFEEYRFGVTVNYALNEVMQ